MALISDEDINNIIEANDLVTVASEAIPDLKQKGGRFIACCPFHKEKTPSFQIDQNKQLWHCFGCGEGGNIVTFVEKIYDMNFPEAMEFLADKANIEIKKTAGKSFSRSEKGRLTEACKIAAQFYHDQLTKVKSAKSNAARQYLSNRNMGSMIAKKWHLGYAPGNNELVKHLSLKKIDGNDMLVANLAVKGKDGRLHDRFFDRVMFPIFDVSGNVIAFGGRIIGDGQPKYLNTGETPLFHKSKVMYGLDKAKSSMASTGIAIVVEGYTDVIAMHESGIKNVVATLGTALTQQHIRLLNQHAKQKIIYLFDGDQAGQRAADRALMFIDQIEKTEEQGKKSKIWALTLPDNMDPKEYIDKYGVDELNKKLNEAKPLILYGIERRIAQYDLNEPGNKARAANAALQVLAPIKESLMAKEYCELIAQSTGMRTDDIIDQLSKLRSTNTSYQQATSNNSEDSSLIFSSSKSVNLEKELLCLFAKHPKSFHELKDDILDYEWKSQNHKKLYDFMLDLIAQNPSIKAKELILKIHQKNKQTANFLTTSSKMLDIKSDSIAHGQYLIARLKLDSLSANIDRLHNELNNSNDDKKANEIYKNIVQLTKEKNNLQLKLKGMI